ncbi:MAG: phosphatase PAP2 family protein [Bacteroides sp.]|nr:phosphatase PAP2 family protein [Bacteroides sp.]
MLTPAYAQTDQPEFVPTSAQKGVATSTDVLMIALPVATLAGVIIEKDWKGLVQGCYTAAATAGATLILKYSVKEWRPDHSNRHSFPSGHTSTSFATAAFIQRRYGWKLGAPAYAVATYVGWGRVFSKKHHWWDAVAGAAIGAGSAYIFTRPWARDHNLSIAPIADPLTNTLGLTASFSL